MVSFFANLLLAIQARIADQVPEIRYIDQDLGQLEIYELRPAVSWPCLLIDFDTTNYSNEGELAQIGENIIQFRLGIDTYTSANSLGPLQVRQAALDYYELENKVFVALHGWDGDGLCQPLSRTAAATEKREDKFRVRIIHFATAFEDVSAMPQYARVTLGTVIEIN